MEEVPSYLRYWGKAKSEDAVQAPCHLLPYHSLDVAAVGETLLARDPERASRLASGLGFTVEEFRRFFVFSLTLHDLGKFARSFQGQAAPAGCNLVPPHPGLLYDGGRRRHDTLGAELWREALFTGHPVREGIDAIAELDLSDGLNLWLGCFFGHHGQPTARLPDPLQLDFLEADQSAARAFVEAVEGLWGSPWPTQFLTDEDWRTRVLAPRTWQLAGLATLADWLGSNAQYFPYCAEPMSLEDYWERWALPGADEVLKQTGLLDVPKAVSFPGFQDAFGFPPTPLQSWAEAVALDDGPQLFLLEDITGSGKTEAALTLAHRLLAEGQGRGLYFGLPTMATSNAMYQRLGGHYRALFPPDSHPSLILAHGARHLEESFTASVVPEPNADPDYAREDPTGGAECRAWLADSRKTALLAEVGVGTIDQALLGVLPRRHQALRLLGLADKVLVVDEVHAYDIYTDRLLRALLTDHARQGGSAILLTATLPRNLRRDLIEAWQEGRQATETEPVSAGFPLATHVHDRGLEESEVAARPESRRDLPVAFVHEEAEAHAAILAAARAGQCACWIRNTVDDAIRSYEALRAELAEPERALLFHARFTMADRQRIEDEALKTFGKESGSAERAGRILIATQVVEQSLDLDFDVLVSDLAPVDLLIQRAGRLHRHVRDAEGNPGETGQPDGRPAPELRILAPEWTEQPPPRWLREPLPGTSAVYRDAAALWRTMKVLREEAAIRLPERARVLLEAVYGDEPEVPEGLLEADAEHWAEQRVAASSARFNALELERGYAQAMDGAGWGDDQEIGTRLADEPTYSVVLIQQTPEGHIRPWHSDARNAWAMSTLNLRQSLANRLPELPPELEGPARTLREEQPGLRRARFWLVETGSAVRYDPDLGAVIPR